MKKTDTTTIEASLDEPIEEHIEMESATGRFRRDAIQSAQNRAAAEALANNRRDMRIDTSVFVASYTLGVEPKKFSLFSGAKKCSVIDASISGLGIEGKPGLNQGDKITLNISDGKQGDVPEFQINATVMYAGSIDKKQARYGLQYDHTPSSYYSTFINSETLKLKLAKAKKK